MTPHSAEADIIRADTRLRWWILVGITLVVALLWLLQNSLNAYLAQALDWLIADAEQVHQRLTWLLVALVVLVSPLLAVGYWLYCLSQRVGRSGQFPPPGAKVLRDTPVLRGTDASNMCRRLRLSAYLFSAMAFILTFGLWWIIRRILLSGL